LPLPRPIATPPKLRSPTMKFSCVTPKSNFIVRGNCARLASRLSKPWTPPS
jgi:hypothetical protein